jgi:type IV pilus assembly protein PilB
MTKSLLRWALAEGISEIQLVPDGEGMQVTFVTDGSSKEVLRLPKSLQVPMIERLKDGANLKVTEQNVHQEGVTPLDWNGTLYDMQVSCRPTDQGEKIVLHLVLKLAAAAS